MSLADIKPYFRGRISTLSLVEWDDPFNFRNIPENLIDTKYHLEIGEVPQKKQNQSDLELTVPVTVRCFKKGLKEPNTTYDSAMSFSTLLIQTIMKNSVRLVQPNIKNLTLVGHLVEPLSDTNKNTFIIRQQYEVLLIIDTN